MAQRRCWEAKQVEAVYCDMAQGMTMSAASKKHCIPRETISNYLSGRRTVGGKSGPDPLISKAEEKNIVKWCNDMARQGFGLNRDTLRNVVGTLLQEDPKRQQFKYGLPGKDWVQELSKNHKILIKKSMKGFTAKSMQEYEKQFKRTCEEFSSDDSEEITTTTQSTLNLDYKQEPRFSSQTDNSSLWDSSNDLFSNTVSDTTSTFKTPSSYESSSTCVSSSAPSLTSISSASRAPSSASELPLTCVTSTTVTASYKHAASRKVVQSSKVDISPKDAPSSTGDVSSNCDPTPISLAPAALVTPPPSHPVDQQIKRRKCESVEVADMDTATPSSKVNISSKRAPSFTCMPSSTVDVTDNCTPPTISQASATLVTASPSSPVDQQIKKRKSDTVVTEDVRTAKLSNEVHEELFTDSVAKQLLEIILKNDRKKRTDIKTRILEFLDSLCSSEEEM